MFELVWLKDGPPERSTTPEEELLKVRELAEPMAMQRGVHLDVTCEQGLPELAVDPVAFRQAVLSVLTVAMVRASCTSGRGQVNVSVWSPARDVCIRVWCRSASAPTSPSIRDEDASLDMARRLAEICDGKLVTVPTTGGFDVTIILPAQVQAIFIS